ncbi:SOS response-associated peptidase [Croceivirga sp. JEA036]|uniref:SOS response-associated peptidase n=1 Tax=Croceivirga sp. JEA036 TaxID=2721162 RepID=UPI00143C5EA6|nr:SOS response-associated peptidase family protein [Croceivirga sp. JEA036]NJB37705.1 SOS response-associated peptidase [Croceivirga sp. JEA036]
MIYKLSNVAAKEEIEEEFGVPFEYPELYNPRMIINGFKEENLPIITLAEPEQLQFAIWGLMPNGFKEDWMFFQKQANTLNISKTEDKFPWAERSLENDRCLITVTGFYTYLFNNGKIEPFLITLKDNKPFFIAGVYSKLEDGFLTCAVVTTGTYSNITDHQDISNVAPLIISKEQGNSWLRDDLDQTSAKELMGTMYDLEFNIHSVPKKLFEKEQADKLLRNNLYPFSLN